jgi:phosphoadenosine phosphosulfate reductase
MRSEQKTMARLPPNFNERHHALSGLDTRDFLEVILRAESPFGPLGVVSSFGVDSSVLLHLISRIAPALPVLFIDTGFHFEETLAHRNSVVKRLGLESVRTFRVDPLSEKRVDGSRRLHRTEPDSCCQLRKVQVLDRALRPFNGWISGQKRFQTRERAAVDRLEWDVVRGKWKFNPLADWSNADLLRYRAEHQLPEHPLEALGYRSVGCAPCTTPVAKGEDVRAGRWREHQKLECGLHGQSDLILASGA